MNNNVDTGIAVIGRAWDDFVFGPIPFDNTFKGNTALNNPLGDLFEMVFDFADGRFEPHPDGLCPNSWKKNTYGTAVADEGCIARSTYF